MPSITRANRLGNCTSIYNYEQSDWSGVAAVEALRKGLEDLEEMCGHMLKTFKVNVSCSNVDIGSYHR